MKYLKEFFFWRNILVYILFLFTNLRILEAFLKSVKVEEIPFSVSEIDGDGGLGPDSAFRAGERGIHAVTNLEKQRGFLHLFHIPYILCFYAAKGKWPFIPAFMQVRVDAAAKGLFAHDDGFIKNFCVKWIQIKECFRPIFGNTTVSTVERLSKQTTCACPTEGPAVFFDRDHIGKVGSETILNTIEFLESFLPEPTKKPIKKRRKNRVRGRIDEMNVE